MNKQFKNSKGRQYFEGWYLKQQNGTETVALIPAFHRNEQGEPSASLQVITDTKTYHINFPAHLFCIDPEKRMIFLGKSAFSKYGCKLDVQSAKYSITGTLRFRSVVAPSYDIMGPFRRVPFMECRHSVFSLYHRVDGQIAINDKQYVFENGSGYMEGDRGVSFPKRYLWTHCSHYGNSIMLSIAEIPLGGVRFIGCTGFLYWDGVEHRIATYCGVKLLHISNDTILLRQGKLSLKIKLLAANSQLLRAPQKGSMSRFIRESASCKVQYTCKIDGKTLFDFVSEQASYENNWRDTL